MARQRSHSIEFKRQVAQEFIAGESLHVLSKRHDISRQLIRVWVQKYEAGAFLHFALLIAATSTPLIFLNAFAQDDRRHSPAPAPFIGAIPSSALWTTLGSAGTAANMSANTDGTWYIDFPVCDDATSCWLGYVQTALSANLTDAHSITITYEITGTSPVFSYKTQLENTCPGQAAISLLLREAGDNLSGIGPFAYYRWYSLPEAQPLALGGPITITVPLTVAQWTPVFSEGAAADAAGFAHALANVGWVGFVFGGGCFASHGVAVTSGSARFTLNSYSVQ